MDSIAFSPIEKFFLAGLTALAVGSFSLEVYRRLAIVFKGTGSLPFDRFPERLLRVFRDCL